MCNLYAGKNDNGQFSGPKMLYIFFDISTPFAHQHENLKETTKMF